MFDTLDFTKRAQEAGFTQKQAEFLAQEIYKILMAKKDDQK
jgi:hypothetical protein